MTNLLCSLHECEKQLKEELAAVDDGIARLEAVLPDPPNSRAISVLTEDRGHLRVKLDFVESMIHDAELLEGAPPLCPVLPESGPRFRPPSVGQYSGMKLSTAAQAYLSERGRGPVLIAKVVEDLNFAGVLVGRLRVRVNTQHLRLLCSNNRTRFQYDREKDTISLRTEYGNDTGRTALRNSRRRAATLTQVISLTAHQ